MTLQMGGGLLVGTALLDGGYHAWQQDDRKSEQDVSSLSSYYDFSRTYRRRRNKPSLGAPRDGCVMPMRAQRSFETTVLVVPRRGFLLRDVTRFLVQPYRPERTKTGIQSMSHGHILKVASVCSVD